MTRKSAIDQLSALRHFRLRRADMNVAAQARAVARSESAEAETSGRLQAQIDDLAGCHSDLLDQAMTRPMTARMMVAGREVIDQMEEGVRSFHAELASSRVAREREERHLAVLKQERLQRARSVEALHVLMLRERKKYVLKADVADEERQEEHFTAVSLARMRGSPS